MENKPVRSTGITVLSIINWVFAGFGVFIFLITLMISGPMEKVMDLTRNIDTTFKHIYHSSKVSDTMLNGDDSAVYQSTAADTFNKQIPKKLGQVFDETLEYSRLMIKVLFPFSILGILCSLLLLIGTTLIFRMSRTGLYFYILGIALFIAGYIYLYWPALNGTFIFSAFYWVYVVLMSIFGIGMILLYYWQMKKNNLI